MSVATALAALKLQERQSTTDNERKQLQYGRQCRPIAYQVVPGTPLLRFHHNSRAEKGGLTGN